MTKGLLQKYEALLGWGHTSTQILQWPFNMRINFYHTSFTMHFKIWKLILNNNILIQKHTSQSQTCQVQSRSILTSNSGKSSNRKWSWYIPQRISNNYCWPPNDWSILSRKKELHYSKRFQSSFILNAICLRNIHGIHC